MAYTTAQLVTAYTNANLGKAPDAATTLALDAYATQTTTGGLSDAAALSNTLKLVNGTTAVAIETYQFFTGAAPSAAGLAYLVNSTTNTSDLNDSYYSKFGQENRFINFSINLATGAGAGAASFAASYGGVTTQQAVATAYDKIIGNAVAQAAGVDPAAAVAYLTRADNITYLTNFVKANTGLTAAGDIDLAVKAAIIGEILNAATNAGLGGYAAATTAMVLDLSDGSLSTDSAAGVNILTSYPSAGVAGKAYSLTVGPDTLVGTTGNDTFTALPIDANSNGVNTVTAFDSIDGGAGVDTLNIYSDNNNGYNNSLPTNLTVKNVEIINIYQQGGSSTAFTDASIYSGVQQLWQIGSAADVSNVGAGVTVGFRGTSVSNDIVLTDGTSSATIALDGVAENSYFGVYSNTTAGSTLNSVTITGTTTDSNSDGTVAAHELDVYVGKNVTALTVKSAANLNLYAYGNGSGTSTHVTSVDASGSTGNINFSGDSYVSKILGGSGNDTLSLNTQTSSTITASVSSGAGDDSVFVSTYGSGATTVDTGAGNDTLTVYGHGSAALTATLGDGNDTLVVNNASAIVWSSTGTQDAIDGGAGTDTIQFSATVGTTLSATSNFSKAVTNFEKISITALGSGENGTIDMAQLNNINYVVTAGGTAGAGTNETAIVQFSALANGQSVTVGGQTYVNSSGATMSGSQVATAVASQITVADGLGGNYTANVNGNAIGYTASTVGNATNITTSVGNNGAVATVGISETQGVTYVAGTTENSAVTFQGLLQGESTTVNGLTVTANTGNLTATDVANTFGGVTAPNASVSGSLSGFTAGSASGQTVTFTSTTANQNVTDISVTTNSGRTLTVNTTQGSAGTPGQTELGAVTFATLRDGQSITLGGLTVKANGADLPASVVAAAFANNGTAQTNATITGSLSGWTTGAASGSNLTFTSTTSNTNVADLAATYATATAPTAGVTITDGTAATGILNLNNFVNGGTVELTGVTGGTTNVNLKDASGTSDVVNIKINGASNIVNTGTIVVAGVETINLTTADSTATADPTAASKPNLVATSAATVTVTGNHGVNFAGSNLSGLTTLDTSGVVSTLSSASAAATAAAVSFTAAASSTKVLSITTGMGNDFIDLHFNSKGATVNAGNGNNTVIGTTGTDTIITGSGNDTVVQTAGADTITLGAGNDRYILVSAANSTLSSLQTLTDFSANTKALSTAAWGAVGYGSATGVTGDVIDVSNLLSHSGGNSAAGVAGGNIQGIAVSVVNNAADAQTFIQTTFQNSANTGFALDSSTGKLYLDFNHDGNVDSVIQLTGVATLTTAAFYTGLGNI